MEKSTGKFNKHEGKSPFSGEMWIRLVLSVDYLFAADVGITIETFAKNVPPSFLIIGFQERPNNLICAFICCVTLQF
jgi:hypothetical protein